MNTPTETPPISLREKTQLLIMQDRTNLSTHEQRLQGSGCFPLALLHATKCLRPDLMTKREVFSQVSEKTKGDVNLYKIIEATASLGEELGIRIKSIETLGSISSEREEKLRQILPSKDEVSFVKNNHPRTTIEENEAGLIFMVNPKNKQAHVLCINGSNETFPNQTESGVNLMGGQNEYNLFLNDGYIVVASIFLTQN